MKPSLILSTKSPWSPTICPLTSIQYSVCSPWQALNSGVTPCAKRFLSPATIRDPFVETFDITNTDPNQDADHIFVNTWAKRAFVGSTMLLRLAYLNEIGLTEETLDGKPVSGQLYDSYDAYGADESRTQSVPRHVACSIDETDEPGAYA